MPKMINGILTYDQAELDERVRRQVDLAALYRAIEEIQREWRAQNPTRRLQHELPHLA